MKKLFLLLCSLVLLAKIEAQFLKKVLDKTKQKTEDKVSEKVSNKVSDAASKPIDDVGKSKKGKENPDATNNTKSSQQSGNEIKTDENAPATLSTYSKYDFVPGEKILVVEDFTQDNIGDFQDK